MEFSRQEDLPNLGIESGSPALQADTLPTEPLGKPKNMIITPGKNTGVGCDVLLQWIFPTQRSNPCLPHCR